jgi:glutamine synthetase
MINTIIAESLDCVAEEIARASKGRDFNASALKVISKITRETKPVRFEGNNYSDDWIREAKRRGLANIAATCDALKALKCGKNIKLFEKYKIFSAEEIIARYHIWVHTYNTMLEIEANTLIEMVSASVVPSGMEYEEMLADNLTKITALAKNARIKFDPAALKDQREHLSEVVSKIYYVRHNTGEMIKLLKKAKPLDHEKKAKLYFEELKPLMEHIRKHVDDLERVVSDEHWDLPKYREMLFIK